MSKFLKTATAFLLVGAATGAPAQTAPPVAGAPAQTAPREPAEPPARTEDLKMAALEALIAAPPEKALPIVKKVLEGNASDDLKERALFILSQIDLPEAEALLLQTARSADDSLREEAIRMIGIGGGPNALAALEEIYAGGDEDTREAVLQAYLIANDADAVYRIAANAQDPDEFEEAVEILGAMGALEQLRALRHRGDMSESLIQAYAVAGDTESLRELARDGSDPERQAEAIHGLGIAGGPKVGETLVSIYRETNSPVVKEAVREGLMIAGDDQALLQLFRESRDTEEKQELLQMLVNMDSDAVWEIIDSTLENGQ
jgi:HEAT repeat protein